MQQAEKLPIRECDETEKGRFEAYVDEKVDVVKAVTGKRKKWEASEQKKIVGLWKTAHEPIRANYITDVTNRGSFINFEAVIATCNELQYDIPGSRKQLNQYITEFLTGVIQPIHDLQRESSWDIAVSYFTNRLNSIHFDIRSCYLKQQLEA